MTGISIREGALRPIFQAAFIVAFGLFLSGCTTTLTESHTAGSDADQAVKVETKNARVVLMPLDIQLTELTAAGLEEPKADWTEAARAYVTSGLTEALAERGLTLRHYKAPKSNRKSRRDDQLVKLHSQVGGTILIHHYNQYNRLPTKHNKLDWTLGSTARQLGNDQGAELSLFVFLRDSYATGGRKAAMVASTIFSSVLGTPVARAGERVGFASLVDLRTGDIVWFNILYSDKGDLRESEPAREVVNNLLNGFPT